MGLFSPAQLVGYIALALGITAFLQKSDDRLKFFNATQGLFYALHFILLGNLPASASSLTSSVRSFLALRYRSWVLGAVMFCANIGLGLAFARTRAGWLPSHRLVHCDRRDLYPERYSVPRPCCWPAPSSG